ncbi:MAG: alkaline phosphatase family protein [Bacteroidetes bacterium]|nr:alkaline phosphatase family protein [Bacteroidota bacterium]
MNASTIASSTIGFVHLRAKFSMRYSAALLLAVWLCLASCSLTRSVAPPLRTIAFGSCDHQDAYPKMWDAILANRPDLWIWGGDNIYGDSHDMDTLRTKYARQKAVPGYQTLRQRAHVTGTWDDHDYGLNDGGREYAMRAQSRDVLFDFLDIPARDPARTREGAYHSRTYGPPGRKVTILNLDTRYFRDPLWQEPYADPRYPGVSRHNVPAPGRDILGESQWAWLEHALMDSTASLVIINSSIQVLSSEHPFEKWANFPDAQQRLYRLIARSEARQVLILSGDRHIGECSAISLEGRTTKLYDMTSSGLTHTWSTPRAEPNRYRLGEQVVKKNFGLIRIDWSGRVPRLRLELRGEGNQLLQQWEPDL